ncbi:hypothetical protein GWK47_023799 [Chionoecetes opilio]|uniref:Uncharacterized protein n=1 Tax=Chionoecetes opilio TaxID=41210 RepID=A0A8J4XM58_CHIOP|nr:hypothetical protein GWK47_023799 [Chionoecetes opilio]
MEDTEGGVKDTGVEDTEGVVFKDTNGGVKDTEGGVKDTEGLTAEPSGGTFGTLYQDPVPPEKPAFKVAQALYDLLVTYDSTDSLIVLQVCSLLSSVNEMQYNAEFRGVPGGEDLTEIPEYILVNMSTDQQVSYQLVQAVKRGVLPSELQEIKCGKVYFKLYYDIKVHHRLEDGPKHILTQLRVMRSQPKKVQTAVTFYVRTGAWFAHSECVLLSLMASQSEDDRSLQTLISWQPGQVHEPAFTCSLSGDQIQEIPVKPYEVPEFSIHTQSTERVVQQVTEAAAAVVGQQASDGFIRGRAHHWETMPCFRSKKDMMDTF